MGQAQCQQKESYNKCVKIWEFSPGRKVLLLLPDSESKLLKKWQGVPVGASRAVAGTVSSQVSAASVARMSTFQYVPPTLKEEFCEGQERGRRPGFGRHGS